MCCCFRGPVERVGGPSGSSLTYSLAEFCMEIKVESARRSHFRGLYLSVVAVSKLKVVERRHCRRTPIVLAHMIQNEVSFDTEPSALVSSDAISPTHPWAYGLAWNGGMLPDHTACILGHAMVLRDIIDTSHAGLVKRSSQRRYIVGVRTRVPYRQVCASVCKS